MILLGHGLSVPRTAAILSRSAKTIERHKESISEKLALKGQAEIVQVVSAMGLDLSDAKLQRIAEPQPEE
jgi:DNA-binding NarL/FixJ family response regulator